MLPNRSHPPSRRHARPLHVEALEDRRLLATIAVTNTNHAGPGSLRAAIEAANLDPGGDTIAFDAALRGTILTLHSALPDLTGALEIAGPGADKLTVARSAAVGTPEFRIFTVVAGAEVTISGLTLSGGRAGDGGGIANAGSLTVFASAVTGNSVTGGGEFGGGGIYNAGTLTVAASAVSGNTATYSFMGDGLPSGNDGGGIYNAGTLAVTASTVNDNSASANGRGGGVFNAKSAAMTVTTSAISRNATTYGGGIANAGTMTVTASTISRNQALGGGGGILNDGTGTITTSTLSGNSVENARGFGGGIVNWDSGTMTVTASTLSGNSARFGDIWNEGALEAASSIFFANIGLSQSGGTFVSGGHNLFSYTPAVALEPTDLVNTDPLLGPLADNGGPTLTHALLPGSPAVDAGAAVAGLTTDQRGISRPQGASPDIGAFELAVPVAPAPTVLALRRFGSHPRPTALVLTFSTALDPARAQDVGNYRLAAQGPRRRTIRLRAARYDVSTQAVTLAPIRRLPLSRTFVLTVEGTPPDGLTSTSGVPLAGRDGQAGTDYVAAIDRTTLVRQTPSPGRSRGRPGA